MKKLALCCLTAVLTSFAAGHVNAQANLSFSGGFNAPLTLTLDAPVTYAVTTASASTLYFNFQGTGNININNPGTSTITFSINNAAPVTLTTLYSGYNFGAAAETDSGLYNGSYTLAVGDTVQLLAGTFTTTDNVAAAAPASGAYQTFLVNDSGTQLDAINGTSVPEPSTWALLGLGAVGSGVVALRRRRAQYA